MIVVFVEVFTMYYNSQNNFRLFIKEEGALAKFGK